MCRSSSVRPADRYCEEDFVDELGYCKRELVAPKQLTCPSGYSVTDAGCIKDVQTVSSFVCNEGNIGLLKTFNFDVRMGFGTRCLRTSKTVYTYATV